MASDVIHPIIAKFSSKSQQESLALASMAQGDSPTSSMAPASSTAAAMRGKVGSEFET